MTQSCPKKCGGTVHVYCTRKSKNGKVRFQYLRCRDCHAKPTPKYNVVPCSTKDILCSTNLSPASGLTKKLCDDGDMNTSHDIDTLSAWETAAWFGVTVAQLMELEFSGQLPSPRTTAPVTWHEDDLVAWMAQNKESAE